MKNNNSFHATIFEIWKENNKKLIIEAQGFSMEPVIFAKDKLTLDIIPASKIKIGDIAAYLQNGNIIVHRIVKKVKHNGKLYFFQKGDNLSGYSLIKSDDIIGRVNLIQRGNKEIKLQKWNNLISGIIGWILIMSLDSLRIFKKRFLKKEINKKGGQ